LLREAAGGDGELVRQLRDDREAVPLDAGDRALLDFVTMLTFSQQSMEPRDLDALRAHGFADLQVLEIATLAGFFNFITRVADALGVESNPERKEWEAFLFRD
jgi:alkylhydroperoxidase family enzyme